MRKKLGFFLAALFLAAAGTASSKEGVKKTAKELDQETIYQFKARTIDGKQFSLSHYRGKVVLIVNVASQCGYTPQYEGLQNLYERYRNRGFEVAGFPCNQFGSQEPGTDNEIKTFCDTKYHVRFRLFSKIEVNGEKTHPLYQFLKKAQPGDIGWNFTKFLIDEKGQVVKRFPSSVKPEELEKEIQALLTK